MPSLVSLHSGPPNSRIGILFVHGVDGDHRKTWTNADDECWIDWIKDIAAPIYAFSHEASKTDLQNIFSLDEIADHLRRQLEQHPEIEIWIFVCHSLGGLIAKRAYVEIAKSRVTTCHFVFFGTPHRPSRFYFVPGFISSWLHREHIVRTLTADESYLDSLNGEFLEAALKNDCQILSFYENRRFFGLQIVSKAATIIGGPYVESTALYGDHSEICKFLSPENSGYLTTRNFIIEIVEKNKAFKIRPYSRPIFPIS